MTAKEKVLELLKQQKNQTVQTLDKREWAGALKSLMSMLEGYLADAATTNLFDVRKVRRPMDEQGLGHYLAPTLELFTPRGDTIVIKPRARQVVGSHGRVDLESATKKAMLVRKGLPDDWQFARLAADSEGWTFKELSEESFWETLEELLA
jgi:hypothetical protein